MFQLMNVKPEIKSTNESKKITLTAKDTDITFENICFEYVEGKRILDNLSFSVPAGKLGLSFKKWKCFINYFLILKSGHSAGKKIAIVGGSGSGKSTLIRLLYRFYEPNSGCIKIAGHNINALDLDCLRKHIAIVPQDSVLFHNTIKHNINYGNLEASEAEVIKAAQMAEIHNSIQVSS